MSFLDKFRGNKAKAKAKLPQGAKVVRRRKRWGGSDVGYYHNASYYLLDGTYMEPTDYLGTVEFLPTDEARSELEYEGYDASTYTAPSNSDYITGYGGHGETGGGKSTYGGYDYGSSASSDTGSSYGGSSSSYDGGSSSSSSSDSGSSSSSSGGGD